MCDTSISNYLRLIIANPGVISGAVGSGLVVCGIAAAVFLKNKKRGNKRR